MIDFCEITHNDSASPAWPIPDSALEPLCSDAEILFHVHRQPGEAPGEPSASGPCPFPAVSHVTRILSGFTALLWNRRSEPADFWHKGQSKARDLLRELSKKFFAWRRISDAGLRILRRGHICILGGSVCLVIRELWRVETKTDPVSTPGSLPACRRLCRFVVAALLPLAGCQPAVMDPQGPVGAAEKTILLDSLAIMLAIVVPTIAATLTFAWWFRASNTQARYLPDWAYSGRIELVTWGVPLLTIMLLGGVTWVGSHDLDPAKPLNAKSLPLQIEAVSLDWKWLFIYPDQRVASVNQLMLPAGVPVSFSLTSASVMNTFFIPRLGSMIYTMNGMSSKLNLMADKPGEFRGLSAHFSGDGFSDMHFEVHAIPADRFSTWISATRNQGPKLDEMSFRTLEKPSGNVTPFTYGQADPTIFDRIVTRQIAPAPGPVPAAGPSVINSSGPGH